MTRILDLDIANRTVTVETGIVRDQLNDVLKEHSLFFAPSCAPSSRATIGGMINTDACGAGSAHYGRTSQHVIDLTTLFINDISLDTLTTTLRHKKDEITARFPERKRFMTGYNLAHAITPDTLDINALICGSEGTLGLVTQATLRLTPLPTESHTVIMTYPTLKEALDDVPRLLTHTPIKFELLDDTLLDLARNESQFQDLLADIPKKSTIHILEFHTQPPPLGGRGAKRTMAHRVTKTEVDKFWHLIKTAVGLMGALPGRRKPIPFIEDTAVDPTQLSAYITQVKAVLDRHNLQYGIYGHPDVGCLHIRPALDLTDPQDDEKMAQITQEIHIILQDFNGVMWAEHGKGFRSCYTRDYVGDTVYDLFRQVKATFDPKNRLNPVKIVAPTGCDEPVVDSRSHLRGHQDRQISTDRQERYQSALDCNGNGACFQYHPDTLMCPTWKATRDRVQSPKGRAALLREWSRLKSINDPSLAEFEQEMAAGMDSCLSCKACTSQCPIYVDIPEMKARYVAERSGRRPIGDYLVAWQE